MISSWKINMGVFGDIHIDVAVGRATRFGGRGPRS